MKYLLFSGPLTPDKYEAYCPSCRKVISVDSDSSLPICCHAIPTIYRGPLIQSGIRSWLTAFRKAGHVGEEYCTLERDYLEQYDIIHVNYTPGHPHYIEAVRSALGNSDTKIIANIDYALSMWETIEPRTMKRQLDLADLVFHVEEYGAFMLERYLNRKVFHIPHPVDTQALEIVRKRATKFDPPLATCQYHRYHATWSAYYYSLHPIKLKRFLVGVSGKIPPTIDLETLFDRVVPTHDYQQYIETLLSRATINLDLTPDYTYGRGVVDAAALGVPTVASVTCEAARVCYPELTVNPFDHKQIHDKVLLALETPPDIVEKGSINASRYSCANMLERLMEALDGNYRRYSPS
jgi:hypothetical protein